MIIQVRLVRSSIVSCRITSIIHVHESAWQDTGRRKHKKKHKHKSTVLNARVRFQCLHSVEDYGRGLKCLDIADATS